MKITHIIGEQGAMPQQCRNGGCPAALLADNGDVFVQGYIPAASEGSELTPPVGEGFVRMSREVFEKIARQVLAA